MQEVWSRDKYIKIIERIPHKYFKITINTPPNITWKLRDYLLGIDKEYKDDHLVQLGIEWLKNYESDL